MKGKQFLKILLIFSIILLLAFVDENGNNLLFISNLLLVFVGLYAYVSYRKRNIVIHPLFWFIPILVIVFLSSIYYIEWASSFGWYKEYRESIKDIMPVYLKVIILGALGGLVADFVFISYRKFNNHYRINENKIVIKHFKYKFYWACMFLILSTALLFLEIYLDGGLMSWVSNLAIDQFNYSRPAYAIRQINQFLWFPSFSYFVFLLYNQSKRNNYLLHVLSIIFLLVYLGPKLIQGDRSPVFLILIIYGVNYYLSKPQSRLFKPLGILVSGLVGFVLLVFLGELRKMTSYSFGGSGDHNLSDITSINFMMENLGSTFLGSNGTLLISIIYFPVEHAYLYGESLLAAMFNLLPSFLFDGTRPFLNPSLLFHDLFASGRTDMGFGLSVLTEGYMNFGLLGSFVFVFLSYSLIIFIYNKNIQGKLNFRVLYPIVIFSSIWFIRGDSTAYIKSVFVSMVVIFLITFLSRLRIQSCSKK